MEEKAARAYDMAALKYWGPSSHINFPVMITFFLIFLLMGSVFSYQELIESNLRYLLTVGKLSKRT